MNRFLLTLLRSDPSFPTILMMMHKEKEIAFMIFSNPVRKLLP